MPNQPHTYGEPLLAFNSFYAAMNANYAPSQAPMNNDAERAADALARRFADAAMACVTLVHAQPNAADLTDEQVFNRALDAADLLTLGDSSDVAADLPKHAVRDYGDYS